MAIARKLLVEGNDDNYVVFHLCKNNHIPLIFDIVDKKGIDNLLDTISTELKASDLETLGILVDADTDLLARWQAIQTILQKEGYLVPRGPMPNGTILTHEEKPKVGIWLMPNNNIPGMLEDFVAMLIPNEDVLWPYVQNCVQNLPDQRFSEYIRAKANIHTWLAWQAEPGKPMGLAITARYFNHGSQEALRFTNWLQELFIV